MATMATNHVSVAMGQVATTSFPRYSHYFFSNYIIPTHYDQMLFFSVYSPDIAPSDYHLFRSLQNSNNGECVI